MSVRVWSAAVAAVILGTVAGCSSGANAGGDTGGGTTMPIVDSLETTNLTVYDFPAIDSTGLYIAENEGLFKEEGLHVTVVADEKSSQDTVDMIESGKAQISSGDYVTYMGDFAGVDPNLEIIAEGSVLRPDVLTLMSAPHSKITTLKQLEGKAIPVSGKDDIATLLIDSVLAENNVPISSVHYVPNVPLPGVPSMIAAGKFVTGPVPEPFVSMGEQQEGDGVLADMDQGATSNFPVQGYAVTKQWAQQNPNTLKAFTTALEEGQEIADTNRAELEKAIEGAPLKIPVGVADVISLPDFPTGIDPARLQRVMDDMLQYNFFTGKELTAAKDFQAKNVVYTANLANADGQSELLGG
jgi:NitT/TauT family transport system substrate-binding protein